MGNTQHRTTSISGPAQHVQSINKNVQFKLHVTINFGVDSVAMAFTHHNQIWLYNKWRGKKKQRSLQTKASILINRENQLICFGNNAKWIYSNLQGKEKKQKKFFEQFTMVHDDTHTKEYIMDSNGRPVSSKILYIVTFKHLQELMKHYLHNITKDAIQDNETQWIITMPEHCSQSSRNMMTEWVSESGLVDRSIVNQCLIVNEAECALYDNDLKEAHDIKEGSKCIVMIIGRINHLVCKELLNDGSMQDGVSVRMDGLMEDIYLTAYAKLLGDIFGHDLMHTLEIQDPCIYKDVFHWFKEGMATLNIDADTTTHIIELPFEFMTYLEEILCAETEAIQDTVEQYLKPRKYFQVLFAQNGSFNDEKDNNDTDVCIVKSVRDIDEREYLEMDVRILKCIVDSYFDKIIAQIHNFLSLHKLNDCTHLCVLGTLKISPLPYLQYRLNQEFGAESKYKLKVVVPDKPNLCVVRGAAHIPIEIERVRKRAELELEEKRKEMESEQKAKNDKESEVKLWLTKQVELPQYIDLFINDGYDEMITIIKTMTEEDLLEIGVTKRGHRKKIMLFIGQLKKDQEIEESEKKIPNQLQRNERISNDHAYDVDNIEGANIFDTARRDNMNIAGAHVQDTLK
eukprot:48715_1